MKTRIALVVTASLAILVVLVTFFIHNQEPVQVFPATINRDCAPWDGSAFMVSIPMDDGTSIDISIWQSPNFNFPKIFSFPDNSGQVGNVSYRSTSGEYEPLSGTVFFWRVYEGSPIEGRFDLMTKTGQRFEGQFEAGWGNQIALCG